MADTLTEMAKAAFEHDGRFGLWKNAGVDGRDAWISRERAAVARLIEIESNTVNPRFAQKGIVAYLRSILEQSNG